MSFADAASEPVGELVSERLACDDQHLLATHNPWLGETWCRCGSVRLPGFHSTNHERFVYAHAGANAPLLGYEHYTLTLCPCHPEGTT